MKLIIGRAWCPACAFVAMFVKDSTIKTLPCPKCGAPTMPASGDEV